MSKTVYARLKELLGVVGLPENAQKTCQTIVKNVRSKVSDCPGYILPGVERNELVPLILLSALRFYSQKMSVNVGEKPTIEKMSHDQMLVWKARALEIPESLLGSAGTVALCLGSAGQDDICVKMVEHDAPMRSATLFCSEMINESDPQLIDEERRSLESARQRILHAPTV